MVKYFLALIFFVAMTAHAESDLSVAKSMQNPLGVNPEARHFVLPFENYTNFGYAHSTQNILDLKPTLPFGFTASYDLIFRPIIPLTHQPTANGGSANGLGDINPTVFLTPATNRSLLWGIGPTVVMPTATNKALGAGKWSVGPELVLISMPGQWVFAILTDNIWSIAGEAKRASVNLFTFQYFITYNFAHGWYVTSQPTLTANWFADGQKWVVPFGIGGGRTFHVGNQTLNLSLQSYYNAIRPSGNANWTLQMNVEFLFPDPRTVL